MTLIYVQLSYYYSLENVTDWLEVQCLKLAVQNCSLSSLGLGECVVTCPRLPLPVAAG